MKRMELPSRQRDRKWPARIKNMANTELTLHAYRRCNTLTGSTEAGYTHNVVVG